jgi:hypothetical protein
LGVEQAVMGAGFAVGSDRQRLYALEIQVNRLIRHLGEVVVEPLAVEDMTVEELLCETIRVLRQIRFGVSLLTEQSLEEHDGD